MGRAGREFAESVKRRLRERVAYMCSNPLCRRLTVRPQAGTTQVVRQGKAAHIVAAAPGGARSNPTISDAACRSFDNGIWLCDICARLVDDDRDDYPASKLQAWKTEAEGYVAELSTQDTRLRQLRGMVTETLSSLRILSALIGPGPRFDQTFQDANSIPLARRLIEAEQLLFENGFIDEANKVRSIGDQLVQRVYTGVRTNPNNAFLEISSWKNRQIRVLMIEIMRFSEESYQRYLDREMGMVRDALTNHRAAGAVIRAME